MKIHLGINNCFAVKRWPEPLRWGGIVRETLGLQLVQFSLDLLDPRTEESGRREMLEQIRAACGEYELRLSSVFTGLAAYSSNMLLHPSHLMRMDALAWYERAIELSGELGGTAAGGHWGALSCQDYADSNRREYLEEFLFEALGYLADVAKQAGLQRLLWEPMPLFREAPATIREAERLHGKANRNTAVPIDFCLDLGHQCTAGAQGEDRDPYEWLRRLGAVCPYIHLQQTDGEADHHWPFTEPYNASGIIHPDRVLDSLEQAGVGEARLVFEIIHPFEDSEQRVIEDLKASVDYWKGYLP
jgi:sugar phosphate isomerase/epimerase